jgi:DNA replicative helicase MCM subunit Mcm2 (Cdc46/Mcm family)
VIKDEVNEDIDKAIAEKMLKRHSGNLKPKYDVNFLKKFFAYIRNLDEPKLDKNSNKLLKEAYFKARKIYSSGVKINPRFLESLTRMSISSAKLRQGKKVEIKDIKTALKILSKSQYKINEELIIENKKQQK